MNPRNAVNEFEKRVRNVTVKTANEKKVVLVVDDVPDNLTVIIGLLQGIYKVKVANSGARALQIAMSANKPDIILLDIMMPEMDGYEVCRQLQANPATRTIPVIFLTAKNEIEDEKKGLDLGAVDYITKPISPPIIMARIATHLQIRAYADFLENKNEYLEQEILRRTQEIVALQNVTILAMAALAESRDSDTGFHIRRTQLYVQALCEKLRENPQFSLDLTDPITDFMVKSTPLHDIGKVGIPDKILLKPGRLTPEEFEIMKTHTLIGWKAIDNAEKQLGEQVDFLKYAKQNALYHHEKWDGSGYPNGLAGNDIPLCARIMAIADVYDALITPRVYKAAIPEEEAVNIIKEGRGSHFDPVLVDAFLDIRDQFALIAGQYRDSTQFYTMPH